MTSHHLSRRLAKKVILLLSFVVLTIAVLILVMHAQQPIHPSVQAKSIFASEPDCVSPCWRGITPGISSRNDFLDLLQNPTYRLRILRESQISHENVHYIWDDPTIAISGRTTIAGNMVTQMSFKPRSNTGITLSTILEELGPPDYFLVHLMGSHDIVLVADLFYEKKNTVISIWANQEPFQVNLLDCRVDMTSDLPIQEIHFLERKPLHLWMSTLRIPPTAGLPQAWQGLGSTPLTSTRCQD